MTGNMRMTPLSPKYPMRRKLRCKQAVKHLMLFAQGLKAVNIKNGGSSDARGAPVRLAQRESPPTEEADHFIMNCLGDMEDRETIMSMDATLEDFVNGR